MQKVVHHSLTAKLEDSGDTRRHYDGSFCESLNKIHKIVEIYQ